MCRNSKRNHLDMSKMKSRIKSSNIRRPTGADNFAIPNTLLPHRLLRLILSERFRGSGISTA